MSELASTKDEIPVSAPVNTDSAGKGGPVAMESVMRVICPEKNMSGTAFLHKSGKLITAAHVVEGCDLSKLVVLPPTGQPVQVANLAADSELDIALITLKTAIRGRSLQIRTATDLAIGSQVSTWGFPEGYGGRAPLLSAGYLSGIQGFRSSSSAVIQRWVVNAAFNSGNSGGPLVNIEDGTVIGVVSSKLAPMPPDVESAIDALTNQKSGFQYTATRPDGTTFNVSEGQVVATVLQHLRRQTQLVIGHAVNLQDLRKFLQAQGVTP